MDEGADVVQVKSAHLLDSPGGVLKGRQTHVKVDLIQVSTVKGIQLETPREALKCDTQKRFSLITEFTFDAISVM